MAMTQAMMPCDKGCEGTGRVKREVRKMADGSDDPLDFRREETCAACGGSGKIVNWGGKEKPEARESGFVADKIGVRGVLGQAGTREL